MTRQDPDTVPETSGLTLHWAPEYDIFSRLMGMGVNRPNSRMVVEMAGVKTGDHVLDIGCGTGNLTITAKTYAGPDGAVYGIDASPEMIEVARKNAERNKANVTFELGLIEKLPFPDGPFDVVLNRLVIHHLPDDLKGKAFAEILRVLKPGGQLFIADFKAPRNHMLNHLAALMVGPNMMKTELGRILPMLTEAGFVELDSGPTRSAMLAYVKGKKR